MITQTLDRLWPAPIGKAHQRSIVPADSSRTLHMPHTLNAYGDQSTHKMAGFGNDISSQRLDDLDKAAISCLLRNPGSTFLDLGCGEARVGLAASLIAGSTILVDAVDLSQKVQKFRALMHAPVRFLHLDAKALTPDLLPPLHIAYSQRFIHYLRYAEALDLLSVVFSRSEPGASLFLSASGIQSELGDRYEDAHVHVEDRYCPLEARMAEKHNILGCVCLYDLEDLERLATSAGYQKVHVYRSDFGNIKGIFQK